VAAVSVDITPEAALPLSGYAHRRGPATQVRDRLEANVLAFHGDDGGTSYLVSVDALYGGALTSGLRARLDLRPAQLTVMGSHTHFAPGVDPALAELGATDPAYVAFVVDRVATAIEELGVAGEGATASASASADGLLVNRRRPSLGLGIRVPRLGSVVSAPHRNGPVDSVLRLARVTADGQLVAVLWGLSCHPVCSPDPRAVSPCFPGVVRAALRQAVGGRVPVLFAQGFSADVRPASTTRRPPRGLRSLMVYAVAGGARFVAQDEDEYRRWCGDLAGVALGAERVARSADSTPTTGGVFRVEVEKPAGWSRSPVLSRIEVSHQLTIVSANAEIPSERVARLADVAPGMVMPSGCADEVIGYWPTDAMLAEGGYEGADAARHFPALDWSAVGGPDALWSSMWAELLAHRMDRS
jgi:hypothetical protein